MRLFFIRHGQAEHNRFLIINESNQRVSNLTEQGRGEAAESAKKLKQKGIKVDAIYCSPLTRCRQTAKIVKQELGEPKLKTKIDKRLAELKTGFNNQFALIWLVRLFLSRNKLTKKFKGGQSIVESFKLVEDFWQEIHAEHLGQNVLIIAHLNTFQMLCHFLYDQKLRPPWHQQFLLSTGELFEFKPRIKK